ncbi:Putative carbon monoxide dehydrogenase small subunit [Candidatus Hydrogenisulfobacillus filiaventi]|uniref:Carbon monoxide dehydrogenase n=1 Tax=Candidatus Hydrogenisulfobacillus filiaventi TaxID=2707344 RepID=A0A6F8ZFC6_9FIRM|nr:anaerobic carbon-monoxide dehydrogenase catalytic subunit [Bacillota bacterium]CAB1128445.1 Putative carbon monoxide dehydrogenase small subunit [Candidatus Hydrogenisulfobacillus filiaventi]
MHTCTSCTDHASIRDLQFRLAGEKIPTIFDRRRTQSPFCQFGRKGTCCTLCPDGPCRIRPGAERGICGIDADGMVARNLLRLVNQGGAAYTHDFKHTLKTLRAVAEGQGPFRVADPGKLTRMAARLGLPAADGPAAAAALAAYLDQEFRKDVDQPLDLIRRLAPPSRVALWERLGILPGGYLFEGHEAAAKVMPNIDTDYQDLLLTALRLGLSAGFLGNIATTLVRDVVLGSPAPTSGQADVGVLDPAYVNIVAHGHVPWTASALAQVLEEPAVQAMARQAGAKGIRLLGSMCVGQELTQRPGTAAGLGGQLGNWISQEFWLSTGAVDLVMMDKNCSTPALPQMAERTGTRLVPVSGLVHLRGVEDRPDLHYEPARAEAQARQLAAMAVEAYRRRQGRPLTVPEYRSPYMAGFGLESLSAALGGSLLPLVEAIAGGQIQGVVGLVSCTNTRNGQDLMTNALIRELIRRDIPVLVAGCAASAAQVAGLAAPEAAVLAGPGLRGLAQRLGIPPVLSYGSCLDAGRIVLTVYALSELLGVDPSRLPVAAAAPEYYNNDALIDALLAVASGITTLVGPLPPVTGGPGVTSLLTTGLDDLLGARFLVEEQDPVRAADLLTAHLQSRRQALTSAR